jgi:hypothetical protein
MEFIAMGYYEMLWLSDCVLHLYYNPKSYNELSVDY